MLTHASTLATTHSGKRHEQWGSIPKRHRNLLRSSYKRSLRNNCLSISGGVCFHTVFALHACHTPTQQHCGTPEGLAGNFTFSILRVGHSSKPERDPLPGHQSSRLAQALPQERHQIREPPRDPGVSSLIPTPSGPMKQTVSSAEAAGESQQVNHRTCFWRQFTAERNFFLTVLGSSELPHFCRPPPNRLVLVADCCSALSVSASLPAVSIGS